MNKNRIFNAGGVKFYIDTFNRLKKIHAGGKTVIFGVAKSKYIEQYDIIFRIGRKWEFFPDDPEEIFQKIGVLFDGSEQGKRMKTAARLDEIAWEIGDKKRFNDLSSALLEMSIELKISAGILSPEQEEKYWEEEK